jgi:hypothetical protein
MRWKLVGREVDEVVQMGGAALVMLKLCSWRRGCAGLREVVGLVAVRGGSSGRLLALVVGGCRYFVKAGEDTQGVKPWLNCVHGRYEKEDAIVFTST